MKRAVPSGPKLRVDAQLLQNTKRSMKAVHLLLCSEESIMLELVQGSPTH